VHKEIIKKIISGELVAVEINKQINNNTNNNNNNNKIHYNYNVTLRRVRVTLIGDYTMFFHIIS
jgi:hypothetical protein